MRLLHGPDILTLASAEDSIRDAVVRATASVNFTGTPPAIEWMIDTFRL